MKKSIALFVLPIVLLFAQCETPKNPNQKKDKLAKAINAEAITKVISELTAKHGASNKFRIEKGVNQVAVLWNNEDGSEKDFEKFCAENFLSDAVKIDELFNKLQTNFEILFGNFNKMGVELKQPLHLDLGEVTPIDELFGSYNPGAHLTEDLFANKVAFTTLLNFPFYTLKEKMDKGANWSRKEWAYARIADVFTSRVLADLLQKISEATTNADTYIANYNIFMGNLQNESEKTLFPKELRLITHWGLRDELKSHYGDAEGLAKQQMIYEVMKKIITQEIPDTVINNKDVMWNPYTNKVSKDGKEIKSKPEPNTRYEHLLNVFHANKAVDVYSPQYPDYIKRNFEEGMQMTQEEIEKLFIEFVSAPEIKKVATLISRRLNRKLQPFDIWYDGFKTRSTIPEDELSAKTKKKYPTRDAFQNGLVKILEQLDFSKEKAEFITSHISVDASRGAGHAWQSEMKSDKAHLRSRIGKDGMDYKGYNIAVHEFGHNVEQTLSLHNVDYYILRGVPNTAFTEALAFIFQKRDLELLGIKEKDKNKMHLLALDDFWAVFEIMGVSLVDMNVWKWLYANPDATSEELKKRVIIIAKDIWNKYYAEVFGIKDQPILAIYSHMIDAPLYLSAYPIGHLISFQVDKQLENNFGNEVERIYTCGSIEPQAWMKHAVGSKISIKPMLNAADEALKEVK